MNELNDFKMFVRTIPSLKDEVVRGNFTWQQIYEMYVLYGDNHEIWSTYRNRNKKSTLDLGSIMSIARNIDLNALSGGLESIQKVLGIVSTMVDSNEGNQNQPSKEQNIYTRYDD